MVQVKTIFTRKNFIRNWVLYVCVLLALFGFLLSIFLYIRPCDEQMVSQLIESQAPCDIMVLVDISGSVGHPTPFNQEVFGVYSLLEILGRTRSYRAGLIQFNSLTYSQHDIGQLRLNDLYDTNTNTTALARAACSAGAAGNCGTEYPFSEAQAEFDTFSEDQDTFKLIVIVSDGVPNTPSESYAQSVSAKQNNITIAGIIIGTDANPLYSMTSCTDDNNQQNRQVNESCPYFAKAANFDDLEAQATGLADLLAKEVPIRSDSQESSICVGHPAVWGFLLLTIPLLLFLFGKPIARAISPPKPLEEPLTDPSIMDSTIMANPAIEEEPETRGSAGSPPPVVEGQKKWANVEAGNYLWAMGGRAARLVTINYGDKGAPPSAPASQKTCESAFQAKGTMNVHANATRRKTFSPAAVAETVSQVYAGTELEVRVSRAICCCCWWGLSEDDKEELSSRRTAGA